MKIVSDLKIIHKIVQKEIQTRQLEFTYYIVAVIDEVENLDRYSFRSIN